MRPLLLAALLALGGCSAFGGGPEIITLYVAADAVPCVGEGYQTCLQVRETPEAAWERFYDDIAGFTHEPGVAYVLRVEVREVADPPADGSSLAYRLVEILQRSPVEG